MRFWVWLAIVATALGLAAFATDGVSAPQHKPPYYASIAAGRARMRTGPGRNYPAIWMYRRADLPIKVVAIYQDWRKIEDPDGTQGWMLSTLLSSARTAIVTGGVTEMRAHPDLGAAVNWRAAPGVVGRISDCDGAWCWFDVQGKGGYVEETRLWGVDPGERLD